MLQALDWPKRRPGGTLRVNSPDGDKILDFGLPIHARPGCAGRGGVLDWELLTMIATAKRHLRRTVLGFLPTILAIPLVHGNESEWPGWRGPDRDARVEGFAVPEAWPEELESTWSVEVGAGYSSPLVVGNRVYQHARQDGEEVLWCLDLASGKPLWRKSLPVDFEPGRGGERHGKGPKSTPTIAGGRVFTLSITGVLAAWDAESGELVWKRDFSEDFEEASPYWGTATSPVFDDGRLFVHTGSCEKGALFCLDPATGKDVWVQDEHAHCYSSPILATIAGVRQLVEFNHSGLSGFDPANGRILWHHDFVHRGNNQNTPTPVIHDGVLVVGGENRGVFGIRPRKEGEKWVVEEAWQHREVSLDMSSPVVNDGLVYGFSHLKSCQFFCLEASSGEVQWTGAPRAGENAQFLSLPGHVLALTDDGLLHVLRADGKATTIVREYRVAEDETWTAPVLVGDTLLIKDRTHLALWRLAGE